VAAANLNPDNPAAWSSLLDFYVRQHDVRAISDTCSKILSMRPAVAHLYGEACTSLNETP